MTRQQAISVLEMVEAHGLADEAKNIAINALKVFCDDNCEVCEFEKCPLTEGVAK